MNNESGKGIIIIVSGPSASGKGTVVSRALEKADDARVDVQLSVSMTTRGIGKGETEGETYYYVSKEDFEKNIADNNLVEYNSYAGEYYGTPKDKLDGWLKTFVTCRLARKLSILLKQGVSIIDSLRILRYQNDDVLVRLLAHHFDETLLAGEDFERSLDMEYFDDRFHSLCLLGLKSDDFPGALEDYIAIVETGVNLQIRKISVMFQVICYGFVAVTVIMAYQVLLLPLEMLQQF